jgi:putative heme transporter
VPSARSSAAVFAVTLRVAERWGSDWRPRLPAGVRRSTLAAILVVLAATSVVVLLAGFGTLKEVLRRLEHASPALLAFAAGFEALSFGGYVVLTRTVFRPVAPRISWAESVDITLAGVVATRLVTAGGIGGIALTAWALRGAGLDRRTAVRRVAAFLVLLYEVFFAALLIDATGLAAGILPGGAPPWLTLTGAGVGGLVIGLSLAALLVPGDLERRAGRAAVGGGRLQRLATRVAPAPAVAHEAVALALRIVRTRPSASPAAVVWWACDIAVLWSTFEMFGAPPTTGVLVLCYFLGKLAQVVPVPGGVGPVEGGMVAAFAACGIPVSLAVLAVLAYQAISTWLPAAPGLWGYLRLRRNVAAWRAAGPRPAPAAAGRAA